MKKNKMGEACGTYGGEEMFSKKPEGKKQLGRPWCRWVDNIKMYFQ